MNSLRFVFRRTPVLALLLLTLTSSGCLRASRYSVLTPLPCPSPPAPLGATAVDPFFQQMESNAEASDFVVYEHEFIQDTNRLTPAGEDHVRQIAARLPSVSFPVIVETSAIISKEGTTYEYPVHNDPELDMHRRFIVVKALELMGIGDADSRVVVAPALATPYTQFEAGRAYNSGLQGFGRGGGFGGLGGGFGGGIGGIGGGIGGGFGGFGF